MRSFASLAVAAAVALNSASVLAAVGVPGNSAHFAWEPSSGPVKSYLVEVARNGGAFEMEKIVSGTKVTITGQLDDRLSVRVIALGSDGSRSVPSEASDAIKFTGWGSANDSASNANNSASNAGNGGRNANNSASNADKSRNKSDNGRSDADKSRSSADDGRSITSSGSNQPPPRPANPGLGAMPYDFNGDGRTDMLWRNVETNAVAVWLMNGTSSPQFAVLGRPGEQEQWDPVGSGDFDGDGYADLLLRNSLQGTSEIWLIDKGRVRSAISVNGRGANWTAEAIGDFDGDGYADVFWQKKEKSLVWFMRGSAVDEEVYGSDAPESSTAACAPELDGDGRSDLIWSGGSETVAWLMDGSSPWRSGRAGPLMQTSLVLGCGDADGDGLGDVLWYHPGSRRGILWVMNGDVGKDRSFGLPPLGWGWAMEASGDFDGDGLANDVLVRHASTGAVEIWKLQWNRWRTDFGIVSTEIAGRMGGSWQAVAP